MDEGGLQLYTILNNMCLTSILLNLVILTLPELILLIFNLAIGPIYILDFGCLMALLFISESLRGT